MYKNKKIFLGWFVLVVLWNFGVPEAQPLSDVLVATLLSLVASYIKHKKNTCTF